MFSRHDFIMEGLLGAVGKMPDYKVILSAAVWSEKGILKDSDLASIEDAINKHNNPNDRSFLI